MSRLGVFLCFALRQRLRTYRVPKFETECFKIFVKPRTFCTSVSLQDSDIVNKIESSLVEKKTNFNYENLKRIVAFLLKYEAIPNVIVNAFIEQPSITSIKFMHWDRTVNTLLDYGFTISQTINIIFSLPGVLGLSREKILSTLDNIKVVGLGSEAIINATSDHPQLLMLSQTSLNKRAKWLKEIFPQKDVIKICKKNPEILCYPEEQLNDKLQYITTIMGLDQPVMIKSNVWTHSLTHIRIRHEFLERVGMYVRPNPKNRKISRNPKLDKMLDLPDDSFSVNIAKVTAEEYKVFCKLAKKEGFLKDWDSRIEDTSDDELTDLSDDELSDSSNGEKQY